MRPELARAELRHLVQTRAWQETTVAFTFIAMMFALTWQQAFWRNVWGYRILVGICAIGAMTYLLRHIAFADGRAGRLERGFLAEADAEMALGRMKDAKAYRNVPLSPSGPDVDFVVLHGRRLVCIEVKARPSRRILVRQADHLQRTSRRRALHLRSLLAKSAQAGRLPNGIPVPHSIVVCRSPLSIGPLPAGMVWPRSLREAIAAMPNNLTEEQAQRLPEVLEDMETPAC